MTTDRDALRAEYENSNRRTIELYAQLQQLEHPSQIAVYQRAVTALETGVKSRDPGLAIASWLLAAIIEYPDVIHLQVCKRDSKRGPFEVTLWLRDFNGSGSGPRGTGTTFEEAAMEAIVRAKEFLKRQGCG